MAPSSIAARGDEAGAAEVREVTRNLWLIYLESFDTRTDAYFFVADKVNQTQSGVVREGFEKCFKLDFLLTHSSAVTTMQRTRQFLERRVNRQVRKGGLPPLSEGRGQAPLPDCGLRRVQNSVDMESVAEYFMK